MSTGSNGTTPADLETDIARQREALAETVTELQARLDVKTRTKEKVAEIPQPVLVAGALGVLVAVVLLVRRRTR